MSSPVKSTLPNEPVEVDEPLIIPVNSNPLVKAPLIEVAICAELDINPASFKFVT